MSSSAGRNIRLFLVDGTSSGLITAEIMNWTGHVLAGSRSGIVRFLDRPELDRTGVYFLFGRDPEDPDTEIVYIGESDNVRKRLSQHNRDDSKGYWERTCVVTSKDQNITKAHARYLEARLIAITKEIGRTGLGNTTAPTPLMLPEADQSDMEFFIEQVRLVLPVLGYEFLRHRPRTSSKDTPAFADASGSLYESPLFELTSKKLGLAASAREVDGEFVVLAGSLARASWQQVGTSSSGYSKLHQTLVNQGKLLPVSGNNQLVQFAEDAPFSSPSAASAIIYGRADNGRTSWQVKEQNITYAKWQEQQVEATPIGDSSANT